MCQAAWLKIEHYFDFDKEKVIEYAKMRNPNIDIIFASSKTGEGINDIANWIMKEVNNFIN